MFQVSNTAELGTMVHAYKPSTWEAGTEGSKHWDHPGLDNEALSPIKQVNSRILWILSLCPPFSAGCANTSGQALIPDVEENGTKSDLLMLREGEFEMWTQREQAMRRLSTCIQTHMHAWPHLRFPAFYAESRDLESSRDHEWTKEIRLISKNYTYNFPF